MTSPRDNEIRFGGWEMDAVPAGWEVLVGFGLRQIQAYSNIGFKQELLSPEMSLQEYAEVQIKIMHQVLPGIEVKAPKPSSWSGAEEALEMAWRLVQGNRQFVVVQILAKGLGQVGIATFTTTDGELSSAGPGFRGVRERLKFTPEPLPAPVAPATEAQAIGGIDHVSSDSRSDQLPKKAAGKTFG